MCLVASARLCVVDLATELFQVELFMVLCKISKSVSVSVDLSVIIREINISVLDYISSSLHGV